MKENKETIKSRGQGNDGAGRRSFIAKTIFAGAGLAAGSLALAWLMAQKLWIVPIPGTTRMAHMLQNTGAAALRFTPSELSELNASVSAIQLRGQRLPDAVLVFSCAEAPPKK